MKYFFLFFFGAALVSCNVTDKKAEPEAKTKNEAASQKALSDSASYTSLQWLDPVEQDLGTINKGQVAEITWRFKNTGNKPLLIANVQASCGCTIPEKPEEPIAPGEEGLIKAKFNSSGFSGHVIKEVFVEANNNNRNNDYNNKLTFTADIKE